jgi:hypothetical protein
VKIQVTGESQPQNMRVTGGTTSRTIDVSAAMVTSVNGQIGNVTVPTAVKLAVTVAAASAPAAVKAAADYVCDGVADQVQIQAAIDAAQASGGGIVQLSPGGFNIAATITVNGTLNENDPKTITLRGCGQQVTELTVASGITGITISNWAQIHLADLGIFISGSGIGIKSVGVNNVANSNNVSFWHSSFRNLRINGGFVATDTVWGMELGMPWRSEFSNIEIEGCRNGIKLINNATMQNAGDNVFSRFFVEIVGTDGYALYVDSIDGNMNQNTWIDFEAGANSTGCTGIYLGGTAGTASQRFIGNLNLEQFQTLINIANGNSNTFDCNYITCDTGGSTNKGFVTGSNSYNNTFRAAYFNIASSDSVKVIEDGNTTSNAPNIFERIRIENNASGTVTYSKQNSTVLRDIVTFNSGNAMPAGLLQYPLAVVNNPTIAPADHGLITWTHDPATCRSTGDNITSGTVYLCKVKIVDRATVGLKTVALTSPQTLAVGTYYVAILMNSTGTVPQLLQGNGASASALNAGLATNAARFLNTAAGNTSLPTSITLGSQSTNAGSRWVALS